jgi:hypothetical protein
MLQENPLDDLKVREIARIIYDVIFLPGKEDDDGFVMPPFEEAEHLGMGGFERAVEAARKVLRPK